MEDARLRALAHESWPSASKSYVKATRLYGDEGYEPSKAPMLENAQAAREYAEADAKAAAAAEAARMAPIMAAREAAADAAMEALLAEEEQEEAATAKSGKVKKGKRKGQKK